MAATRRKKIGTGSRFKTHEGRRPTDKHVRITNDMATHTAFLNLSYAAKVLYLYLKLWACGNDTVVYSASMASAYNMDAKQFRKARNELIKAGFIVFLNEQCAKYKRETGKYQFVSDWYGGAGSKVGG